MFSYQIIANDFSRLFPTSFVFASPHATQSCSDDAVPIRWQCPAAVTTRTYTAKSDVYSFGVLVWEVYSGGATPFGSLAAGEVVRAVQAGERLSRPSHDTPEDIVALIRACTCLETAARPSMATVHARLRGAWTLDGGEAAGDRRRSVVAGEDETAL